MSLGSLRIRGGTLVTMDRERRLVEGDLLIEEGRIVAVGDDVATSADVPILDASGMVVLPGFVQGHVHLGQAMFRGLAEGLPLMDWLRSRIWPLEAAHDDDSAYGSAMLGIADCLLSGTTTIHEIGIVRPMDPIFAAIEAAGIRAVAGKCLMDQGEGVPPALLEQASQALAEAESLHGRWQGAADGRITTALCPRFILSCSQRLWEGVVELAHRYRVGIHTHLLEHPGEGAEIRAALGEGELEYFDRLGVLDTDLRIAHGVQLDRSHVDILAGRPLSVVHCPSANLKLGSGIADLGFLGGAEGIVLGIGCDGAPCNNDLDVLEEMRLCALLQQYRQGPGRFTAEDALALATIEGARALGLEDTVGSLEVGKAGDVCIWDLERPGSFGASRVSVYDRLVYGAARDALVAVVVDGVPLVDRGRLLSIDGEALLPRTREQADALLDRAQI